MILCARRNSKCAVFSALVIDPFDAVHPIPIPSDWLIDGTAIRHPLSLLHGCYSCCAYTLQALNICVQS